MDQFDYVKDIGCLTIGYYLREYENACNGLFPGSDFLKPSKSEADLQKLVKYITFKRGSWGMQSMNY